MCLDEKRSVADPSDANLAGLHFGKERTRASTGAFRKERGNPDTGDEIAPGPIAPRPQFDSRRFFRASLCGLANYFALSRKRIRHGRGTI